MLTKQAKTLNDAQIRALLNHVESGRYPQRDRVMVLLSIKAGMRAKEISCLRWAHMTDSEGTLTDTIRLPNIASKGKTGGRVIPMHRSLHEAVLSLLSVSGNPTADSAVLSSERNRDGLSTHGVTQWFYDTYRKLGFVGASSHSGRRTFITRCARKITEAGGSLRDVQALAGHASISTTQRYIEESAEAKAKVVSLI